MSRYFLIYVEIFCDILGSTATFHNILGKSFGTVYTAKFKLKHAGK
jgi:hypothetical protein